MKKLFAMLLIMTLCASCASATILPPTGVDEDFLPARHSSLLHERLPRRQCHQGQRRRLHGTDRCGSDGEISLIDRDALGERADAVVARA